VLATISAVALVAGALGLWENYETLYVHKLTPEKLILDDIIDDIQDNPPYLEFYIYGHVMSNNKQMNGKFSNLLEYDESLLQPHIGDTLSIWGSENLNENQILPRNSNEFDKTVIQRKSLLQFVLVAFGLLGFIFSLTKLRKIVLEIRKPIILQP
jgi:hypothetical protein